MSIKIDSRHLYLQVIDEIKRDIESGKYKEKEKLPSEFQLSRQLGVSRATLREALRILEEENVVARRHGVGTFVNPKPIYSSGIEQLNSVTYMIEQSGKTAGSQYLTTELLEPTEEECKLFSPKKIQSLANIERVRTADNSPVVFCIDKIPSELIPLERVHTADSLFKLMEEYTGKHIAYAVTYIEPISYHDRIYNILDCGPEQSLLLLKQMHYTSDDEPVLYSANYFRPDVFSFHVLRKRM
ncbi:GntR family transcriptional regulator [Virgibacillus profundi]|uniref:GntR family transcriptional regulator n=1 Tax=Virgibacillus profundi TaxID=2024555 RepID=A0A2A2IFC7_9BACI|nr:GntR family transcriptional regulator [Virgibacillus profundi]PAV30058.1 GntR family transcriptional regulator [Virgibacillus profundi]PXY54231.1 GntR family transcriptional regulator [Virgibacillus profundi]